MPYFTTQHCPRCHVAYRASQQGLRSNLGPSLYRCAKCGHDFPSGRMEWEPMPGPGRLVYLGISFVYALTLGLAGFPITVGYWVMLTGVRTWYAADTLTSPAALLFFGVGFFIGLSFQAIRVIRSVNRTERGITTPMPVAWLSPPANPQLFGMIIFVLAALPVLIDVSINGFATPPTW